MKTDYLYWHIKQIIPGEWGSSAPNTSSRKKVLCIRGTDIPNIAAGQIGDTPTRYVKDLSHALSHRDIVIEKSGGSSTQSTGRVAYISSAIANSDQPIVCSNFCAGLTFDNNVDHKYIYYHLLCLYKNNTFFNFETKTNGIHNLMLRQALSSIPTPSASIEYQRAVSTLLYRIDKTTTHSKRVLDLLARLISSIYDYWFVQFDFPDENGRPYKSSGGKMVYNDQLKQEIPEGWTVATLADVFLIKQPEQLSKADMSSSPGKHRVYGSNGIIGSYSKYNYIDSVIAVSCRGNCGNVYRTMPKSWVTSNAMVVTPLSKTVTMHNAYIMALLESLNLKSATTGSIQGQITWTNLSKIKIVIPKMNALDAFNRIADPMYELQIILEDEATKLASLRDWLLPMLMNGQIKIKDEQQE